MKKTIAVLLLCVLFSALLFPATTELADLALINGRIWNGLENQPSAEALAVRGDTILRVGTTSSVKAVIGPQTQVIDLGGRLVTPGFNDAHIHFLGGAQGLTEVDLTGAKSVGEMIKRVAEFARQNSSTTWITGAGWEYTYFPDKLPHRRDLDAVVSDRPVFLRAYDGHSAWANSKALELAGVTRDTKFDGFGEIVHDAAGEPTGALKEGAQGLIRRLIPEPTHLQKLEALRRGVKLAASLGITSIQNASGSPEEFALYEELLGSDELTLRASLALSVSPQITNERIEQWVKLRDKYSANPRLRAGAIKFVLDGVIESYTAALLEPYSNNSQTSGKLSWPVEAYREKVALLDKLGFQLYTHAIGDRAVRTALDAYENAQRVNKRKNTRHRIEHIETVAAADLPRFAKLGVLASMEPIHADPATVEVWSKALGEDRTRRGFAWQQLQRAGARLVFSSDWPASISVDPLRGLHVAVNRRTPEGTPPGGWLPQERLPLAQAFRAYTWAGAYASLEEGIKGSLQPGRLADVIVLSQDVFKTDPMQLYSTKVVLTIFNGKVIYRDGARFPGN